MRHKGDSMKRFWIVLTIITILAFPAYADVTIGGAAAGGAAAATEVTKAATGTLSATEMIGGVVNNYGQTDDATIALASMVSAKSFVVITGTTVAKYWRLDPNGSELIYLDGSSCGAGKYVGVASVAAGYVLSCRSFQTGASAYSLYCSAVTGPWACEP